MTSGWDISPARPGASRQTIRTKSGTALPGKPKARAKPKPFRLTALPPPLEHDWQKIAYEGLERMLPPGGEVFSVDHAGKHGKIITRMVGGRKQRISLEQVRKRQRGCKAGICDMWVFWGGICVPIECKRDDGSQPTPQQVEHHARMIAAGFPPVICRTPEEVYAAVRARGIPVRGHF